MAGLVIFHGIPHLVAKQGLLKPFRTTAMCFPILYIVTPLLGIFAAYALHLPFLTPAISALAILAKNILSSTALVLVILLMLNAAPDAYSTGTVVGLMQVANLFRALAVAVSGASFYLSSEYSVELTNWALWGVLIAFGVTGAALAWFVRERPTVGVDYQEGVLRWEVAFDYMDSVENLELGEPGE
jgi:hypothetical protein